MSTLVFNPQKNDELENVEEDEMGISIKISKFAIQDFTDSKVAKYITPDDETISDLIYQNLTEDEVKFVVVPFATEPCEIIAIMEAWPSIRILSFSHPSTVRYENLLYEVRGEGYSFLQEWLPNTITGGVKLSSFIP